MGKGGSLVLPAWEFPPQVVPLKHLNTPCSHFHSLRAATSRHLLLYFLNHLLFLTQFPTLFNSKPTLCSFFLGGSLPSWKAVGVGGVSEIEPSPASSAGPGGSPSFCPLLQTGTCGALSVSPFPLLKMQCRAVSSFLRGRYLLVISVWGSRDRRTSLLLPSATSTAANPTRIPHRSRWWWWFNPSLSHLRFLEFHVT